MKNLPPLSTYISTGTLPISILLFASANMLFSVYLSSITGYYRWQIDPVLHRDKKHEKSYFFYQCLPYHVMIMDILR